MLQRQVAELNQQNARLSGHVLNLTRDQARLKQAESGRSLELKEALSLADDLKRQVSELSDQNSIMADQLKDVQAQNDESVELARQLEEQLRSSCQ